MDGATVREEKTNVGGQPARYLRAGEGPPLVLLHALGENALDWSWVLPALSRGRRVYAPYLPGIGGDGRILEDPSPTFFASFVAAFLDTLGVERAAIVGNSLGGLVALRLALFVVWGARDRVLPRRQTKAATARLKRGRLVVIPDCGHLPQVEHPDRFADALGRFLDEVEPLRGGTENPENTTRQEER
ncbi:MAG: alpha/beta fold hydrolase [Actinomycetota bacterium]|nr:alpha/beta fold hydrolase [Actinomycetota bacterium]